MLLKYDFDVDFEIVFLIFKLMDLSNEFRNINDITYFFSRTTPILALILLFLVLKNATATEFKCPQYETFCKCYTDDLDGTNKTFCNGKGLTLFPTQLPHQIVEIQLKNTSVSRIPSGLPNTLKSLTIESSNIDMSLPDDYVNIPASLTTLELPSNKITKFNVSSLAHVTILNTLKLNHNPITIFITDVGNRMTQLQYIYLDGVKIKKLDTNTFNFPNLDTFYSNDGILEEIKVNFRVKVLYLRNNKLTQFVESLEDGTNELDLSGNPLEKFDLSKSINSVKKLLLSNTGLACYDDKYKEFKVI